MAEPPTGRLVIISGPSGAGKSTVVRQLLADCPLPLKLSVSATTRQPRPAERDGVDYHFLSKEEFIRRREAGGFLEWMEVFGRGDFYGTLRDETTTGLATGKWVVLEIDIEGTLSVIPQYPEVITIFLDPGSMEELERRLRHRGTESEESTQRRLEVARREMAISDRYRYRVVNDRVDRAVQEICDILTSHVGD
ncbi:MAG: guanylate kinase [Planctomycetes bacterium]|nr:guanylate kinase [Planctomycetota bacterium]MBL7044092.1 guanylate kinase [Pirellulaceae bacterium]